MMRGIIFLYCILAWPLQAYEIHDGHIHYNQSIWKRLPPAEALSFLSDHQIQRAIVSSTPAKGTEMLYELAPERIIPFIRPYRTYKDVLTWHHDREVLEYIRQMATTGIYQGFGEFHMWEKHLAGSILPELMQIAADQKWVLNAHTDIETMRALIKMQPTVNVIWAHCGFEYPASDVDQLFTQYPTAFCDLSLNEMMLDEDDNLTPAWKALMEKHPDRFFTGIDTYKDRRWGELAEHAALTQEWLAQLSPKAASLIANGNVSRLFPLK